MSDKVRRQAQENTTELRVRVRQVQELAEQFKITLDELLKELPHE